LIAYFVGSLFSARLCGKIDQTVGMLHGMAVWAVATTLTVWLGYMGVSSLLQTGYNVAESAASLTSSAVSNTASGIYSAGETVASGMDTQLADNIQARLKRRAATVVSRLGAENVDGVSKDEIRKSIEGLSADDMSTITDKIMAGEMTAAREKLTELTKLSQGDVKKIVDSIGNEFEQQMGTDGNGTDLATDISNSLKRQASDFIADLDDEGGADVSQENIRKAFDQLSPQTMQTVAYRLAQGNVQGAKDSLTANTNLSNAQVNDIVDGVNDDVSRTVGKYQQEAEEAVETASSYAQAVTWSVFAATAMGLAISLLGGWLGTEGSRRVQVEVRPQV